MAYEEFPDLTRGLSDAVDREIKRSFGPINGGLTGLTELAGQKTTSSTTARLHETLKLAELLAQRAVNLHDMLLGTPPEDAGDARNAVPARAGSLGELLDHGDAVAGRVAVANAALDRLERELAR